MSIRLYNFNGMGNQNTHRKGKGKSGKRNGKRRAKELMHEWARRENNDIKIRGLYFMFYSR